MKTMIYIILSLLPLAVSASPYYGGVNADCIHLGCLHGHCEFDSDMDKLAQVCTGIPNDSCLHSLCNVRGDCDFFDRFKRYAGLCGGRDYDDGIYPIVGSPERR